MLKIFFLSTMTFAMMCSAQMVSANDPLAGYEQVEPSAALDSPLAVASDFPSAEVERGQYLVTLLGCGSCHTDGALVGQPDAGRSLAGSRVGIATSNPMQTSLPGVVYPPNLTPDAETGLGNWSVTEIAALLQSGINNHGGRVVPVMPWMTYSKLSPGDANAIAVYLKSVPSVSHRVPARVKPGQPASSPFVHFGVYRSKP